MAGSKCNKRKHFFFELFYNQTEYSVAMHGVVISRTDRRINVLWSRFATGGRRAYRGPQRSAGPADRLHAACDIHFPLLKKKHRLCMATCPVFPWFLLRITFCAVTRVWWNRLREDLGIERRIIFRWLLNKRRRGLDSSTSGY